MRRKMAGLLLAVSGVALACEMFPGEFPVPPITDIKVERESAEWWKQIGDRLNQFYGSMYKDMELPVVRVPVQATLFGFPMGTNYVVFLKACGETFKDATNRLADEVANGSYGGIGGGGGDYAGGGNDGGGGNPDLGGYVPITGCVNVGAGPECTVYYIPAT